MLHFPASMFVCESVPLPTETMFQAFDANNRTNCLQLIQNRMQNLAIKILDTFQYRNVNHPKRVRTPRQLSRIQKSNRTCFSLKPFLGVCVLPFSPSGELFVASPAPHLESRWRFPPPSSVACCVSGYDKPRRMGVEPSTFQVV